MSKTQLLWEARGRITKCGLGGVRVVGLGLEVSCKGEEGGSDMTKGSSMAGNCSQQILCYGNGHLAATCSRELRLVMRRIVVEFSDGEEML